MAKCVIVLKKEMYEALYYHYNKHDNLPALSASLLTALSPFAIILRMNAALAVLR